MHTIYYIDQHVFALVCRKDITCPAKKDLSVTYMRVSFWIHIRMYIQHTHVTFKIRIFGLYLPTFTIDMN